MFNLFKPKSKIIGRDEIAQMLKATPEMLEKFENAYQSCSEETVSDNLFDINAKQAAAMRDNSGDTDMPEVKDLIQRIVAELETQTETWNFDGKTACIKKHGENLLGDAVTLDEINALPEQLRPQLTGNLMKRDMDDQSYIALLDMYKHYMEEKNPAKSQQFYHMFRQGLDILDVDPITDRIIGMNPNSMGYWLPAITNAVVNQDFFKIPKTTIVKLPVTLLQLTRCNYLELTQTTLEIVDEYCRRVFDLDESKDYFIKTGTYSSKFDFRNAHVHGAKEVRELGEYLLYIHFQALQMASPLNQPKCIYGVSTTNEWVVREFIEDKESNPCIYKGLPLHTEYRIFVDFDTKQVIGINPYWDPDVMKQRFGNEPDADNVHNKHDYIVYSMHEETLMRRYNDNKDTVIGKINELIQNIDTLSGQWSIDIMQNGDEFYLIDMALAQNSALIHCVPKELRKITKENWIPKLK